MGKTVILKIGSETSPNSVAGAIVAQIGINLSCIPAFTTVEVEGEERTGIKFILKEDK